MVGSRMLRLRFLALVILALAATAYALAAANMLDESGGGDGAEGISPYSITNIRYTLDAAEPTRITAVQLNVSPTGGALAASEVHTRIDSGAWLTCSGGPATWNCSFSSPYPQVRTSPLTTLRVVSAQ